MRKASFGSLLNDPVKSTAFLKFLKTQHCDESFRFVLACQDLQKMTGNDDELRKEVMRIYGHFCAEDAPEAVFVSAERGLLQVFKNNDLSSMRSSLCAAADELAMELVAGRLDEFAESSFFHQLTLASQSRKAALDPRVVAAALAMCRAPYEWQRKGDLDVFCSLSKESDESFTLVERLVFEDWDPEPLTALFFCDEQHMPLAHPDFVKEAHLIDTFSNDFKVIEWVVKSQALLRTQEHLSVLAVVRSPLPDGAFLLLRKSIPWPEDLLSFDRSLPRASVPLAGYLIEPCNGGSRVTRFSSARLGTSVSLQTRKNMAKTLAKILPKLKQYHNNQRKK